MKSFPIDKDLPKSRIQSLKKLLEKSKREENDIRPTNHLGIENLLRIYIKAKEKK